MQVAGGPGGRKVEGRKGRVLSHLYPQWRKSRGHQVNMSGGVMTLDVGRARKICGRVPWREGKGVQWGNAEGWPGNTEGCLPSAVLHLDWAEWARMRGFLPPQFTVQMQTCSRQQVGYTGYFQIGEGRGQRSKYSTHRLFKKLWTQASCQRN